MSNNESSNAVSLSDHSTLRDSEGRRLPKTKYVESLGGEIQSKPLNKAQKSEYADTLDEEHEEGGEDVLLPSEFSARIFNDVLVEPHPKDNPDLHVDEYTTEYVSEDLHEDAEIGLWIGILRNSGMPDAADFLRALLEQDTEYISEKVKMVREMGNLEEMADETDSGN